MPPDHVPKPEMPPQSPPAEYGGLKPSDTSGRWGWRGRLKLFRLAVLSLIVLPPLAVFVRLPGALWWPLAGLWHRRALSAIGVDVSVTGQAAVPGPVLYVVNHVSWLDILVLGGYLKRASFVAKSEIAGWGFVGQLCALHRTEFVNRARRSDSSNQADRLAERIANGDSLILFPEGTSTDGNRVAPFKSALFSLAERAEAGLDRPLAIQPVSLSYTHVNGAPMTRRDRPLVAWIGDMELVSHLKAFFQISSLRAHIHLHPPVTLDAVGGRKAAARAAQEAVEAGLKDRP